MKNHLVFLENTWKSIYCWRMNGQKILRKNILKSLDFGIEKDTWKSNCWSSPWIFLLIILLLISEPYQCLKDSCGQFFWSFYHFDVCVWPVPVSEKFSVDNFSCRFIILMSELYQCLFMLFSCMIRTNVWKIHVANFSCMSHTNVWKVHKLSMRISHGQFF